LEECSIQKSRFLVNFENKSQVYGIPLPKSKDNWKLEVENTCE